jgi:Fe-S-cluster containining protein
LITVEEILCTNCGLCCDGSLFADVELSGSRESALMEIFGLEIDADEHILLQPCAAQKNKRCSIYQFRPKCCRTFECALLQRVKNGSLTLAEAQTKIKKAQTQLSRQKNTTTLQKIFLTSP